MNTSLISAKAVAVAAFCFAAIAEIHAAVPSAPPFVKQSKSRIAELAAMLPEKPAAPGARISDRAAWDRLAATAQGKAVLKRAEGILSKPVPECPDVLYLEFSTPGNGNRTNYEKPYGARVAHLTDLVFGECLENKGRFLPKIIEYMEAICSERSWVMPAHDYGQQTFLGKGMIVDLGAAHRAAACAWAVSSLKGVLPADVSARMCAELERRVFAPMRRVCAAADRDGCKPMWWFQNLSNWTAVCHSCVTRAALSVIEDRMDRAVFVEGAERSVPGFLMGFYDDGYCTEGIGYWNYGYGNFLTLALAVREATGGKVDFCASEKAKKVMEYGTGILIAGMDGAPIADGGGRLSPVVQQLGHLIWPEMPLAEAARVRRPFFGNVAEVTLLDFGQWERVPPAPAAEYPERSAFPIAQMYVMRPGKSEMPFRLGVKGGDNGEFHNHNDVGTYALFIGDRQLSGDPGGTVYTAQTFSPRRYENKIINSYGHPVPVLNGVLQKEGGKFGGKMRETLFSRDCDTVVLDILGAYDIGEAKTKSLVRTFVYDRAAKRVSVTDKVEFEGVGRFSVPVITAGTLTKVADGTYRLSVPQKDGKTLTAKVEMSVKGAGWRIEEERIDNPNRVSPNRYAITLSEPVASAEVSVVYSVWADGAK